MQGTVIFILVCIVAISVFTILNVNKPVQAKNLSTSVPRLSDRQSERPSPGPIPGPAPGPAPGPLQPPSFITTNIPDTEIETYASQCTASKGVVNSALLNNGLECLSFDNGLTLSNKFTTVPNLQGLDRFQALSSYLAFVYPLYPNWKIHSLNQLETFFSSLNFSYDNKSMPLTNSSSEKVFTNENVIELLAVEKSFKNLDFNTWKAAKYIPKKGTGWFMTIRASLMAYNALHLLCLCSAQDSYIKSYGSDKFQSYLGLSSIADVKKESFSKTSKVPWLGGEDKSRRYICQLAVQRGYQSIQLGYEWNGTEWETLFFDLRDPNFSASNLIRRNPFATTENTNNNYLYLDAFLDADVPRVDPSLIVDPNPKTLGERYGDFAFKTKCRLNKGTISMDYFLSQCLKILKFGSPAVVLDVERNNIDFSKYPQATELEKLQSYFTLVYGNEKIWKTKTLAELQDYWTKCEVHYTSCPIQPATPFPTTPIALTYIGVGKPPISVYQWPKRGCEAVQYVEVIRTNLRYSWYEATELFAATFFYPVRGSGLFLPTGRMFVAADKESAAKTLGVKLTYPNSYEQDMQIVKALLYKGYDTFMCYYIYGHTEIISLKDPIAAQMSLIKTHPWDPILSIPNNVIVQEPYFPAVNIVPGCIVSKQFVPPGSCQAPCVASTVAC